MKELANLYETTFFDYKQLSDILKCEAKFYDNILTQLRPEPEYFRVGFYGLSCPLFVRVSFVIFIVYIIEKNNVTSSRTNNSFIEA